MKESERTLFLYRASAGTGKTYTLAHRYIDLLMQGVSYRSILAVTFTTKATAQMKERILTYLYAMSRQESDPSKRERAKQMFDAMLEDLDNMRITTIDSFLQLLMAGLARMLGKAAGYSVDLDTKHAIVTAVDKMMSSAIEDQAGLKQRLMNMITARLEEDQQWNMRDELIELAEEQNKESVQKLSEQMDFDPDHIYAFRRAVEQTDVSDAEKSTSTQLLMQMMMLGYIRYQMKQDQAEKNSLLISDTASILHRALKEGDADFILEKAGLRYKHIMIDEFQDTSDLQWANFLPLVQEILAGGGTTLIVGDIKQSIYRWRNGNWHIMAQMDNEPSLKNFIYINNLTKNFRSYEQVVRFNLDTFKALSERFDIYDEGYEPSSLQSFYRYPDYQGGYVQMHIYPYSQTSTKPKKDGSLPADAVINLRSALQRQRLIQEMFTTIEELLEQGVAPQRMMILIRTHSQVKIILEQYDALVQDKQRFKCLSQHRPVSSDSFMLSASASVQRLINLLRWRVLKNETYWHMATMHGDIKQRKALEEIDEDLPLTMLLEELIRYGLCDEHGQYQGTDIAYINGLMDKVRAYVSAYGADAKAFLQYWNDKMWSEYICAVDAGNIQIMTIHTAKGLESDFLFIPFCDWSVEDADSRKQMLWTQPCEQLSQLPQALPIIPIYCTKELANTSYAALYANEKADQRVDNINLLYVALTRAVQHLYIYGTMQYTTNFNADKSVLHQLMAIHKLYPAMKQMWDEYKQGQSEPYISLTRGVNAVLPSQTSSADDQPFSVENAQDLPASFFHEQSQGNIFRQSLESKHFAQGQLSARDFGSLCHDILSHITRREQAEQVIGSYWAEGQIDTLETKKNIEQAIEQTLQHPLIRSWFDGSWQVLNETAIFMSTQLNQQLTEMDPQHQAFKELRPDRVMIKNNQAVVLDYKFAHHKDEHEMQVKRYMLLLQQMGYQVKGYLWYQPNQTLQEVKL